MRSIVTTQEHQCQILAAILSDSTLHLAERRLSYCSLYVDSELFTDHFLICYKALLIYYQHTGSLITQDHYARIVGQSDIDDDDRAKALTLLPELKQASGLTDGTFKYHALRLREGSQSDMFVEGLVKSMDIVRQGTKINNKFLQGYPAARSYLEEQLSVVERVDGARLDLTATNKQMGSVLTEYSDRKFGRTSGGLSTGYLEVDDVTSGGFQPGDLVFLPGYTSEGKSTLAYSLADRFIFEQGKNVVLGSAESKKPIIKRRMAGIRSADPRYGFLDGPVNYKRLKEGRLDKLEEQKLEHVIKDMGRDDYGRFSIFELPKRAKSSTIFNIINSYNRQWKVDVFIYDYINYSKSDSKYTDRKDDLTELMQDTKTATLNFDNRRGLITVTPFQVPRYRWETALKEGFYTLACMAETSEAEKSADLVWSILQIGGLTKCQLLKNRDGPRYASPFEVEYDEVSNKIKPKAKAKGLS